MTTTVLEKQNNEIIAYADKRMTLPALNMSDDDIYEKIFKGTNYIVTISGNAGIMDSIDAWIECHPVAPYTKAEIILFLASMNEFLLDVNKGKSYCLGIGTPTGLYNLTHSGFSSTVTDVTGNGSGYRKFLHVYHYLKFKNGKNPNVEEVFKDVISMDLNSSVEYDKITIKLGSRKKKLSDNTVKILQETKYRNNLLGKSESNKK